MAKIDSHPWVKPHADEYRRIQSTIRRTGQSDSDTDELIHHARGKLHGARDVAKDYGQGHDMTIHGEGKPHKG